MARDVSAIAVYHPLALQLKAVIVSSVAFLCSTKHSSLSSPTYNLYTVL